MTSKTHRSSKDRVQNREVLRSQVAELIAPWLTYLDTPRSLAVWMLFSSGEDSQLVQLSCKPLTYDLPKQGDKFRRDYAATKLLAKWDGLQVPWDPKVVAIESGRAAESQCRRTNARFAALRELRSPLRAPKSRLVHLLMNAQKIVRRVIGGCPQTLSFTGWSPGRTTRSFGPKLSALEKFREKPDVTMSALSLYREMLRESPLWGQLVLQADGPVSVISLKEVVDFAEGNVALVVPKNAKTGRLICYEPHANITLQLTAGRVLRRRLLSRAGIDLSDQFINRRLALEGSRSGHLATIDLSSASDTVSRELVQFLLPEEWYHLLDRIRSKQTNYFGSWVKNAKFSSMGNGSTFELETIIFYALCVAVADNSGVTLCPGENFHVYGDDIIVPTSIYDQLVDLLAFSGFSVNPEKSFSTGLFRESCGVDALGGWAITPPMIRPGQRGLTLSIAWHNRLRDYARSTFGFLPNGIQKILVGIRTRFQGPVGPSHYGDGHYHVNLDEASPFSFKRKNGWAGWWFRTRKPFTRSRLHDFLDGSGTYSFRSSFGDAALLAAVAPKRSLDIQRSLIEGGSYTDRLLRVYSLDWECLELLDYIE